MAFVFNAEVTSLAKPSSLHQLSRRPNNSVSRQNFRSAAVAMQVKEVDSSGLQDQPDISIKVHGKNQVLNSDNSMKRQMIESRSYLSQRV